jgi:excisionase family DNA binding protein
MAQKLLTLEEAAQKIGITPNALKALIDRREVFAVKDGNAWKIKADEVDRYLASGSASGSGLKLTMPDDEADSELVTESEMGASAPSSSTIIGKEGSAAGKDSDLALATEGSDLKLSDASSVIGADDSGVALIPADNGSKSGLRLVPSDSDVAKAMAQKTAAEKKKGGGSDLDLVDLDSAGGGLPVEAGSDLSLGSDLTLGKDSGPKFDSDAEVEAAAHGGSDLALGSDVLSLADDDEIGLMDDEDSAELKVAEGGSDLVLGSSGKLDDDEIVLGGSSGVGSGIGDSGINLEAANDSGLSLEEPLELGGVDMAEEGSDELEEVSDDDFLLTPMLELDDQESDSSGSQVIALDTEEAFDDQAATMLGEDVGGMAAVGAGAIAGGMGAAQPLVQPAGAMAPVQATVEAPYGGLALTLLVFCFLFLAATGIMMFEMVQHIWSWNAPGEASTWLMDTVVNLLPKD